MVTPQCLRCGRPGLPHHCLRDASANEAKILADGTEAIVKLNAIKVLCKITVASYDNPDYYDGQDCCDFAERILAMIKGNDEEPHL